MNEYFEFVKGQDLKGSGAGYSWIWYCPECKALFGSKAISNRSIFPWFGYHPADGNLRVITDSMAEKIESRSCSCGCASPLKRVMTVKLLETCILSHKGKGGDECEEPRPEDL